MLTQLLETIADRIRCQVIGETNALAITSGDTHITVERSDPFSDGDTVLISDFSHVAAFTRTIMVKPNNVLWVNEPITVDLATPSVQKMIGGQVIKSIYIGKPATTMQYPSITLSGDYANVPLACGGLYDRIYHCEIGVQVSAEDYESSYRLMDHYASAIEDALSLWVSPDNGCTYWYATVTGRHDDDGYQGTAHRAVLSYEVHQTVQRFIRSRPISDLVP